MSKRYKDLYSILKHPKIKLKIGEKTQGSGKNNFR
jgi:hypothetical protein